MVARTATRSEFTMCVFVSGPSLLHPLCSVTRFGTLRLVTLTLPRLNLVNDTLVIPHGSAEKSRLVTPPHTTLKAEATSIVKPLPSIETDKKLRNHPKSPKEKFRTSPPPVHKLTYIVRRRVHNIM